MDNYVEMLDALMKTKKKKPLVKDKEAFHNAWVGLAIESGFSSRAEQFLYDGFAFCGAEPFFAYLDKAENPNDALRLLFSGKLYGKNSDATFRLMTHLFALMLNNNMPQNVLAPMVARLPRTCINKDRKRLGTAEKTMEKYFFAELKFDAILIPLVDINIKPVLIKEFAAFMLSIMTELESNTTIKNGATIKNIKKVRQWIDAYKEHSENSSEIVSNHDSPKSITKEENTDAVHKKKQSAVKNVELPTASIVSKDSFTEEKNDDLMEYLMDLIGKMEKVASIIKTENIQQKDIIEKLTVSRDNEREKVRKVTQQVAEQQNTIDVLRDELSAAKNDIFMLRKKVEQKDIVIAEKDAEIGERIKMIDVLSRDRSKQADESMQRLASKVRVEYRDFMDAMNVPMSCDLGENLRLQIQNIFDILEKGGMKIR